MIKEIIQSFRKPSAETMALKELEEAKRQLLDAQSGAEYAANMTRYHQDRIKRLSNYLKDAP